MRKIKVAPSIFASDFINLKRELDRLKQLGVDYIHYDIMDNNFVPNISFGPLITEQIAKYSGIPGDVHLMISLSIEKVSRFMLENIEIVTIHYEADGFSKDIIDFIKSNNKKVGISIKPQTPVEAVVPFIDIVDLVLVMTVEPGFSGQSLIPSTISKVSKVREILDKYNRDIYLEVDGGVNLDNVQTLVNSGANLLVIGSAFFKNNNSEMIMDLVKHLNKIK
ncbi:MAG: ribulose-phosphate 3-epimerase [Brevinematales bacterium]|nr:ribulose-phosphate 3-epimerase [Brevinematales bacterium]